MISHQEVPTKTGNKSGGVLKCREDENNNWKKSEGSPAWIIQSRGLKTAPLRQIIALKYAQLQKLVKMLSPTKEPWLRIQFLRCPTVTGYC